jgi:hypothetical protein
MVLTEQAEAAVTDANTLVCNEKYLQDGGKDTQVLESIGPLPPYPVVGTGPDGEHKFCLQSSFFYEVTKPSQTEGQC